MITTIVKVTLAQMRTLEQGGTVGGHTYDPTHCFYVVDDGLLLPEDSGKYVLRTDDNGNTYYYDTIDGIPEVLNVTNGVTQAIKDKVTENHLCALQYGEYIYMPQYGSGNIPTYYNCFEGDSNTFHWLVVDWNALTVEHNDLPYVSYVKTLDTTATTAQTPIREPLGDSGSVVLHKISKTGNYNDLLGKPSTFPPTAHSHSGSDITTGTVALARLPVGTAATQVAAGNHTHSAYVNQNAFGNIKVGSTTTTASSTTDTVTFAAGGDLGVSINGKTVSYSITLPTQLPASDVYPWAKAANKPTYTHTEISAGNVVVGDGANYIEYRTGDTWKAGIYYHTVNDESAVFANQNTRASWIFAYTNPEDRASWRTLTPSLQIKNGKVAINKLIDTGTQGAYNLDVNGTLNATTIYQNGTALSTVATSGSYNDLSNKPTIPSITVSNGIIIFA